MRSKRKEGLYQRENQNRASAVPKKQGAKTRKNPEDMKTARQYDGKFERGEAAPPNVAEGCEAGTTTGKKKKGQKHTTTRVQQVGNNCVGGKFQWPYQESEPQTQRGDMPQVGHGLSTGKREKKNQSG